MKSGKVAGFGTKYIRPATAATEVDMGTRLTRWVGAVVVLLAMAGGVQAQKGSSSGGGRSYSGGSSSGSSSRSYSGGSSVGSSSVKSSSSPGKSYSAGSSAGSSSSSSSGNKPSGLFSGGGSSTPKSTPPKFDSLGSAEAKKAESRQAYQAAQAPKPTYTTPAGKSVDLSNKKADVDRVRSSTTKEKWVNRETRITNTYSTYVHAPAPAVVYNDHFNTFFWLWLLDRSAEERRTWAYHHQAELDPQRLAQLRAKDAEFDARLKAMEGKVARDTGYTPAGLDGEDLMYTDGYVDAAVNPEPSPDGGGSAGAVVWWVLGGLAVLTIAGVLVWAVFYLKF